MAPAPAARKTIVLVDPAAEWRRGMTQALEAAGFAVLDFPDYQGALAEAESDRPFNLLITAIQLPAGTPHGLALVAMTRMRRPAVKVLVLGEADDLAHLPDTSLVRLQLPVEPAAVVASALHLTNAISAEK